MRSLFAVAALVALGASTARAQDAAVSDSLLYPARRHFEYRWGPPELHYNRLADSSALSMEMPWHKDRRLTLALLFGGQRPSVTPQALLNITWQRHTTGTPQPTGTSQVILLLNDSTHLRVAGMWVDWDIARSSGQWNVVERAAAVFTPEEMIAVANARRVMLGYAGNEWTLTPDELEAWRDMASRMNPAASQEPIGPVKH